MNYDFPPLSRAERQDQSRDSAFPAVGREPVCRLTAWLEGGEISPYDVGFKLNDVLLSAIAPSKAQEYGKPRELFKRMAVGQPAKETDKT